MPSKPKKICKRPGCPNTHSNRNGFCDEHQINYDRRDDRPSSYERGYDYRWYKFSKRFLKKYPVCVRCGAPAEVTDHIIPYQIMQDIFGGNTYREEHYQPLCKRCNDLKGKTEDKRMIAEYFGKDEATKAEITKDFILQK